MRPAPVTARRAQAFLPTARQALVVTVFTLLLSWLLHLLSGTPYLGVFGRIGFIGAALLLAYSAAGALRPRWLSLAAARLGAVVLMAPVAALLTALATQRGQFLAYLAQTQTLVGHFLMVVLAVVFGVLFSLLAMRSERHERERADRLQAELQKNTLERELLDARLRLLQAQIEPHFLFNTLANVEALVASGSPNAGPVLRHLIAYLRAAMPRLNDEAATLEQELQLVRAYLELMRVRMPDRLQFEVAHVAQAAGLRFPPMALLTLVENAVRHGIDPATAGGRIAVGATVEGAGGKSCVWVSDTGVGMAETAQPGTGLNNVRSRLQAVYGASARLELHALDPHGVRAELHFSGGQP
ncbi:sensor histidine kinase [Janthinobacterium lividum]|uniref:sensor histidine kinase n=1 Tax=Janthinobacterium lividum TaxID=29581 RepID=UPI001B8390BA|nr:histidine kinase [Janthinobacterium lividum]MBR7634524.1 histidine kinase [Janthinobacterium lividum]